MTDYFDRLGSELERAAAKDLALGRRGFPRVAVAFSSAVFVLIVVGASMLVLRPFSGADAFSPVTQLSEVVFDPVTPLGDSINEVWSVAAAADGSLWAATRGGVVHWDVASRTPTVYTTADGLPTNHASRIAVAPDGSIWTGDSGWVARFSGSWTAFPAPPGVDGPAITVDSDGTLWGVGGENQLYRFDGVDWGVAEVPELRGVGEWSASLAADQDGTIWAATNMGKGLLSFDGKDWTDHSSDLPDGFAGNVTLAPDGTVWIGSESTGVGRAPGVGRLDDAGWRVFTSVDGLAADQALVGVGDDGTVWATHPDESLRGVSRFDGEGWIAYPDVATTGFGLAIDPSGTLWMPSPRGLVGFDGERTTHLVVPISESPPPSATPIQGWNPILTTTKAKLSPQSAVCPGGTDSRQPGPTDQARPKPGYVRNDAAAFDSRRGRVVYADALGSTWAFDVCANTWVDLNAGGVLAGDAWGGLVFDADSDRIVALGLDVSVYDPTSNQWAQAAAAHDFWPVGGAVWDPVSGLIIAHHIDALKAYDVDSDTWMTIGVIPDDPGALLGYSNDLDRLIFSGENGRHTVLVDPRDGTITELEAETPPIVGGFGSLLYTSGSYGAYLATQDGGACWFDDIGLDWECAQASPSGLTWMANAIEHDPLNQRLLLIGSSSGGWGDPEVHTDPVWALDLQTGEWTEVVEPTTP